MTLPNGQPVTLGARDKIAIAGLAFAVFCSVVAVWFRQETLLRELLAKQTLIEYRVSQIEKSLD
jgi:hypothetical protein